MTIHLPEAEFMQPVDEAEDSRFDPLSLVLGSMVGGGVAWCLWNGWIEVFIERIWK